jgi:uncharacterized protein
VRRSIKALARWHWELNLVVYRAWRRLRGDRPYLLGGACESCAACCEEPGISVGRLTWYVPALRSLFLAWQRHVNGFELVGRQRAGRVFLFRCSHFDAVTRRCDSYASRPGMCRDYPRLLLWQASPELLPRCGYRPVAPNAAGLLRVLDAQALSAEQRDRLERGLHLRR